MGNPSLQDMTNKLNQLKANPDADFQLNPEKVNQHADEIQKLIDSLKHAQAQVGQLDNYGEVGSFPSAQGTKQNLIEDVNDLKNLLASHIAYYEAFKGAVQAAGHKLQAADHP
jgi:hypothetical protein